MNKDSSRSHSIFTIYIETSEDVSSNYRVLRKDKLMIILT